MAFVDCVRGNRLVIDGKSRKRGTIMASEPEGFKVVSAKAYAAPRPIVE